MGALADPLYKRRGARSTTAGQGRFPWPSSEVQDRCSATVRTAARTSVGSSPARSPALQSGPGAPCQVSPKPAAAPTARAWADSPEAARSWPMSGRRDARQALRTDPTQCQATPPPSGTSPVRPAALTAGWPGPRHRSLVTQNRPAATSVGALRPSLRGVRFRMVPRNRTARDLRADPRHRSVSPLADAHVESTRRSGWPPVAFVTGSGLCVSLRRIRRRGAPPQSRGSSMSSARRGSPVAGPGRRG
jgi:hypothetical protein